MKARKEHKTFLGFAVTSNKITSQVYSNRHAENSKTIHESGNSGKNHSKRKTCSCDWMI